MKLSEAMMLGSMTGKAAQEGSWKVCALGLSATMAGVPDERKCVLFGQYLRLNERPVSIIKEWPWLGSEEDEGSYLWQISDRFEDYDWSMTQLAEWIKTIEPECGVCNRFDCAGHAKAAAPAVLEEVPC